MSYLKTILTYHLPSEAEVDKSLLESHGITVNLLNAHTTRNELGAPFHIQLQVPGEEVDEAVRIMRQYNPARFGSVANVKAIERELMRSFLRILALSLAAAVAIYLANAGNARDVRWGDAVVGGVILGVLLNAVLGLFKRKARRP